MIRDNKLYSGFVNHDYILTFSIADADKHTQLVALCKDPWQGDQVVPHTWEISNDLSPDQLERAILDLMGDDDHAAYYYRSDAKRLFRVMLG